ncbi:MAG: hypothetical protein HQM03_19955 [Magnetococcales bacterium]|nr:hypothetical protein [Magnetococcales bacterium]
MIKHENDKTKNNENLLKLAIEEKKRQELLKKRLRGEHCEEVILDPANPNLRNDR